MKKRCVSYFISVKAANEKRANLLAPKGCLTLRRIHAVMFSSDKIEEVLKELRASNPDFIFHAVPAERAKSAEQPAA